MAVLRRLVDKLTTKGDSKLCNLCVSKPELAQIQKILKSGDDAKEQLTLDFDNLSEIPLVELLNEYEPPKQAINSNRSNKRASVRVKKNPKNLHLEETKAPAEEAHPNDTIVEDSEENTDSPLDRPIENS